jgi:hypothetical protein
MGSFCCYDVRYMGTTSLSAAARADEYFAFLKSVDGKITAHWLCAEHLEQRLLAEPDGECDVYPTRGLTECQDCRTIRPNDLQSAHGGATGTREPAAQPAARRTGHREQARHGRDLRHAGVAQGVSQGHRAHAHYNAESAALGPSWP